MISSISTEAALAVPGVVAVLTAADLPLVGDGSRAHLRAAGPRRGRVRRAAGGARRRRERGGCRGRRRARGGRPRSARAGARPGGGHQAGSAARSRQGRRRRCRLRPRRRPRVGRDQRRRRRGGAFRQRARHGPAGERRRRRRAGRQPRRGQRTPEHAVDVSGLHRAPDRDGVGGSGWPARRVQRHPGSVLDARLAGQAARNARRAGPRPQRGPGRRVRRQDHGHRPARRVRGRRPAPARCAWR